MTYRKLITKNIMGQDRTYYHKSIPEKRIKIGFSIFCDQVRPSIMSLNPDMDTSERYKTLALMWNNLSHNQRKKFNKRANKKNKE